MNGILLLQKIPYYNNLDCLQMADESNCLKFISLPSVQNLVSSVWNGQISYKSGLLYSFKFSLAILSLGTLAPFLIFEQDISNNLSFREISLKST
jgi:hypothetical protein